jgi:hypothetical protein
MDRVCFVQLIAVLLNEVKSMLIANMVNLVMIKQVFLYLILLINLNYTFLKNILLPYLSSSLTSLVAKWHLFIHEKI